MQIMLQKVYNNKWSQVYVIYFNWVFQPTLCKLWQMANKCAPISSPFPSLLKRWQIVR